MAKGRFLSRSICESEQLSSEAISLKAALFFSWALPQLDVEGRLTGNPVALKGKVVPLRADIGLDEIPRIVAELERSVGPNGEPLVVQYEAAGQRWLWFPGFARHQQGIRKEREAPSKVPPPPPLERVLRFAAKRRAATGNPGVTPDLPGTYPGSTPAQVEVEVEAQGEEQTLGGLRPPVTKAPRPETVWEEEFARDVWPNYPKREGGNPKQDALAAYCARRRGGRQKKRNVTLEPVPAATLLAGLLRYAAYCKATGKIGTEFVMQARTFFGPGERYLEEWALPAQQHAGGRPVPQSFDYSDAEARNAEAEANPPEWASPRPKPTAAQG